MKKWITLGAVLLLMHSPAGQTRLENLKPVELLYVYEESGALCLQTDTGDMGRGSTVKQAMRDMKDASEGKLLLETASYLVVDQKCLTSLRPAAELLRPAASICIGKGDIEPKAAAVYLQIHKPTGTISEMQEQGKQWDVLTAEEGRFCLESRE